MVALLNDSDMPFYAAWLLLNDKAFVRQNDKVPAGVFPKGSLRYLVGLALRHWEQHRAVLSDTIVSMSKDTDQANLRRNGIDAATALDIYTLLGQAYHIDDADLPAARQLARQWLATRLLGLAVNRAADALNSGDTAMAVEALARSSLPDEEERDGVVLSATTPNHMNNLKRIKKGAVPTGFPELDAAWDGGTRPGEVGMIVAPTGIGKSMCLCYLAAQAYWANASVLYYTFELTPRQIRDRITLGILQKGAVDVTRKWADELLDAAKYRGYQTPPASDIDIRGGGLTWPELDADLEDYKRQHGKYPDVLILDSADDIQPEDAKRPIHEQLKQAFTRLRRMAQQKRIRVWTSGQLNRESVERAKVNLRQIGDAFAKAQRSHYVLAFAQTQQQRTHVDGAKMEMFVLKDSLYGTTGATLELAPEFGPGHPKETGYPGFLVEKAYGV